MQSACRRPGCLGLFLALSFCFGHSQIRSMPATEAIQAEENISKSDLERLRPVVLPDL